MVNLIAAPVESITPRKIKESKGSVSIDLAELNNNQNPGANIKFIDLLNGGGSVTQTSTLDGIAFAPEKFLFSALRTNLTKVSWDQISPFHQFDNIALNSGAVPAVPVPAAFWLFGTALIGVVGFSKRRKAA